MKPVTETEMFAHHVERLKASTLNKLSGSDVAPFIIKHTKIAGRPYSFKDHEYQEELLRDTGRETVTRKCSQVGISEMSARKSLALTCLLRAYTIAYTLPTAGFAAVFMKTRIKPIIDASPYIAELVNPNNDNNEVKQIGDSFLYLKGAQSSNAPISVPCDHIIHDEVDFCDPATLSQYHSRLSHSPYKRKDKLSTPTLPDRGIDYEFQRSRRKFNFVKCSCCGFYFAPDYFAHVRIPGFIEDIREITKANLHLHRYDEAFVECPKCGGKPSLQHEHREWVFENPNDNFIATGYQITPFDAPNIISVPYLVESSTQYKRYVDFINFGLGLPTMDADATLTEGELEEIIGNELEAQSGSHVMGIDMGMTCHVTVGKVREDGSIRIVHIEKVPAIRIRDRYAELRRIWAPRVTIMDSQPYTETVMALQQNDYRLYGAVYTSSKGLELFKLIDREEDEFEALTDLRQININRNRAFDSFMDFIRTDMLSKTSCELNEEWKKQLTDMRRIKDWDSSTQEIQYIWVKSEQGNDHFHHSALYMYIASMVMKAGRGSQVRLPLVATMKLGGNKKR